MIYYISDLHFYHTNILKMCNRPFENIEEMNDKLIENWNKKVGEEDTIYFLGDFSFKSNQNKANEILKQLNGKKYFIKGNHDKSTWLQKIKELGLIEDYFDYKEIEDNGRRVILCHYPLHSWNALYRGSYHLYGHVHDKTVENEDWQKNRFNVSCEVLGYEPKTLDEIIIDNITTKDIIKNREKVEESSLIIVEDKDKWQEIIDWMNSDYRPFSYIKPDDKDEHEITITFNYDNYLESKNEKNI